MQIKPRYHFCGLQKIFFERAPYRNHDNGDQADLSTRFIALSSVGGKDKWIYALSLTPLTNISPSELSQHTTDETPCPYPNDAAMPGSSKSNKVRNF